MSINRHAAMRVSESGYDSSVLLTTSYGLDLLARALSYYAPDPHEAALYDALTKALRERNKAA